MIGKELSRSLAAASGLVASIGTVIPDARLDVAPIANGATGGRDRRQSRCWGGLSPMEGWAPQGSEIGVSRWETSQWRQSKNLVLRSGGMERRNSG